MKEEDVIVVDWITNMDCPYNCNNLNSRWENSFKANPHNFKIVYLKIYSDINSSASI
jgi:hypothetical protein